MTDYPIHMKAPMVRALLDGRKTQTRRLAWRMAPSKCFPGVESMKVCKPTPWQKVRPGDRLWVKETWTQDGCEAGMVAYRVDGEPPRHLQGIKWRPSIHMPRWASRLTLTVTEARQERLQDISCADAIAEGIYPAANSQTIDCDTPDPRQEFCSLWNRLHGPDAWETNPEVVAMTFTVALENIGPKEVAA